MIRILVELYVDESELYSIAQDSDILDELDEDMEQFCQDYLEDVWKVYDSAEVIEVKRL